jgi:hypothetical protein
MASGTCETDIEQQDRDHHRQRRRAGASANSVETFSFVIQLWPKSNVKICWRKIQSWTNHGWSRPELLRIDFDLLLVGDLAGENLGRIPAEELEQEEDQQDHAGERRNHLPQAANEVGSHEFAARRVSWGPCRASPASPPSPRA